MQCPASFVRNHDLKRHMLLHDKKAWRCAGCNKIFSRRDAIKRHKDARGRALGGKGGRPGDADAVDTACAFAEIEEVEVDKTEGEEEISRRAKLWNGIAASSVSLANFLKAFGRTSAVHLQIFTLISTASSGWCSASPRRRTDAEGSDRVCFASGREISSMATAQFPATPSSRVSTNEW